LPTFPISDGAGNLTILAPAIVQSIITYPEPDDPRQMDLFGNVVAKSLLDHPEIYEEEGLRRLALQILPHVYSAPRPEDVLRESRAQAKNSWVVGELLAFLINAAATHPDKQISVTKALTVLVQVLNGKPTTDGGTVQMVPRTAWNAWSRFKSVAHIHAVIEMSRQDDNFEVGLGKGEWGVPPQEHLLGFLAIAEHLRLLATDSGFLDSESSWRVPDDVELPHVTLAAPPLPATTVQALEGYIPEDSHHGPPIE